MNELEHKGLAEVVARKEPWSKVGFRSFLSYLRSNVSVEELLADRQAQALIDRTLHAYSSDHDRSSKFGNPYPSVRLAHTRGGARFEYSTFMLKEENKHIFYIGWSWPGYPLDPETGRSNFVVPDFLRYGDVIPAQEYEDPIKFPKHRSSASMPYSKPLERVAIQGGYEELYNYNTRHWERHGNDYYYGIDKDEIVGADQTLSRYKSKTVDLTVRLQDRLHERLERLVDTALTKSVDSNAPRLIKSALETMNRRIKGY